MKTIPLTAKNIFVFLMLLAMTLGFTWLLVHFSSTIKDEPAEETIVLKYSKKGLYLYPRFEIQVSDSERPSMVSKEQFESIEVGDTVSGYMKNPDEFVTEKGIQFELNLGYIILVFLYLVLFLIAIRLLKDIPFISKSNKRTNIVNKIVKGCLYGVLAIYIMAGMVFTVLTATNIVHKLNTTNQTEAEATVMGGDFNTTRSHRGGSYTTYELFITYQDEKGENHISKKAVTGNTYNKYDVEESIPLTYRKNDVHDTFIQTEETSEIWPAFLNLYTFFLAGYLISLFFIIKAWHIKRNKQTNQEEQTDHGMQEVIKDRE